MSPIELSWTAKKVQQFFGKLSKFWMIGKNMLKGLSTFLRNLLKGPSNFRQVRIVNQTSEVDKARYSTIAPLQPIDDMFRIEDNIIDIGSGSVYHIFENMT